MVVNLKLAKGRGSQSGYTMLMKEPVIVDTYLNETRFEFPPEVGMHGVRSGMSVPMMRGEEVCP